MGPGDDFLSGKLFSEKPTSLVDGVVKVANIECRPLEGGKETKMPRMSQADHDDLMIECSEQIAAHFGGKFETVLEDYETFEPTATYGWGHWLLDIIGTHDDDGILHDLTDFWSDGNVTSPERANACEWALEDWLKEQGMI